MTTELALIFGTLETTTLGTITDVRAHPGVNVIPKCGNLLHITLCYFLRQLPKYASKGDAIDNKAKHPVEGVFSFEVNTFPLAVSEVSKCD